MYGQRKSFGNQLEGLIKEALRQPEIGNVTVSLRIEKRDGTTPVERVSETPEDVTLSEVDAQRLRDMEADLSAANRRLSDTETELKAANRRLSGKVEELDAVNSQLSTAKADLSAVNRRLSDTETELKAANKRLSGKETELDDAKSQLRAANRRLSDTETELYAARAELQPFRRLSSVFEAYRAIPGNQGADAKKIISATDPITFLTAAGDFKHILRYWDAVRGECETADEKTRKILADTLAFLLDCHNAILSAPAYALMSPEDETGKPYDRNRHQQSGNCSHGQGNVEKVLLPGIWNLVKNAPERKSVVCYR